MKMYWPEGGETLEDAQEVPEICSDKDPDEYTAENVAEWMHDRSWWENSWPVTFVLVDDDGNESKWEVDRRSVPSFHARRAK